MSTKNSAREINRQLRLRLKYKDHIDKLVDKFRSAVFADEYQYIIDYRDEPFEDNSNRTARMYIDPTYLHFKLEIAPSVFEAYEQGMTWFVADVIMHEMAHLLTQPLTQYFDSLYATDSKYREIEERQVQRIAISILKQIDPKEYAIEN